MGLRSCVVGQVAGQVGERPAEQAYEQAEGLAAGQAAEWAGRRGAGEDGEHAAQAPCPADPSLGGTDAIAETSPWMAGCRDVAVPVEHAEGLPRG